MAELIRLVVMCEFEGVPGSNIMWLSSLLMERELITFKKASEVAQYIVMEWLTQDFRYQANL